MSEAASLSELFRSLCRTEVISAERKIRCAVATNQPLERRFKRILYDELLGARIFPRTVTRKKKGVETTPFERALAVVYNLRIKRFYDRGNRLETALDRFMDEDFLTEKDAVLTFLLCLVESGPGYDYETCLTTPGNTKLYRDSYVLPEGRLFYSDTVVNCFGTAGSTGSYVMYSDELFDSLAVQYADKNRHESLGLLEMMSSMPGAGLTFFGNCNIQEPTSLFSGLTHSTVTSVHVNLDLPPLTDTQRSSLLPHAHQCQPAHVLSTTETVDVLSREEASVDDVWDCALTMMSLPPVEARSWDNKKERRPYLTEAGYEVFDVAYSLRQRYLVNMTGVTVEPASVVSERELVRAALFVVIGVPSRFFQLQEQGFVVLPNMTVSGRSPVSLHSLLLQFGTIGTHYTRLQLLASYYSQIGDHSGGLVRQAFGRALSEYLEEYRLRVISMDTDDVTLFSLSIHFELLSFQLRFLHDVCMCGPDYLPVNSEFPSGIGLLSYLFELTRDNISSPHYLVLLSFLQSSCQPYFLFLRQWLFEGILFDPYGELMIQMSEQYLAFRDKHYWTLGYVAADKDCVPLFLTDVRKDILVCGKAVNLLKLCSQENAMYNVDIPCPKIAIQLSLECLEEVEVTCEAYASHVRGKMAEASHQRSLLRKAQDKEKRRKAVSQRQRMAEAMEMDEEMKAQQRAEIEAKKKALFDDLKSQMEEAIQRRGVLAEEERESDLNWLKKFSAQEAAVNEAEKELEERVRQELIKHYEDLERDAARREVRALWQAARARLDEARRQFLAAEFEQWTARDSTISNSAAMNSESIGKGEDEEEEMPVRVESSDTTVSDSAEWEEKEEGRVDSRQPLGIIPGLFAKEVHPLSLEEALLSVGIGDAATGRTDIGESSRHDVDMKGLIDDMLASVPVDATADDMDRICEPKGVNSSSDVSNLDEPVDLSSKDDSHELSSIVHSVASDGSESNGSQVHHVQVEMPTDDHKSVFTAQEIPYGSHDASPSLPESKRLAPLSVMQDLMYTQEGLSRDLQSPSSRGQAPPSTVQDIMYGNLGMPSPKPSSRGQAPLSIAGGILYAMQDDHPGATDEGRTLPDAVLDAVARDADRDLEEIMPDISLEETSDVPHTDITESVEPQTSGDELCSDQVTGITVNDGMRDHFISTRGQEPPSVAQDIIYWRGSQTEVFHTTRGHAPESTIQKLMYPGMQAPQSREISVSPPEELEFDPLTDPVIAAIQRQTEPFVDDGSYFDDPPNADLLAKVRIEEASLSERGKDNLDALTVLSLPELINRSIIAPLTTQISLVNKAVVAYFIEDLCIEEHFAAIRHFLLLENGEFGHALADRLFTKLSSGISSAELCSAGVLNGLLVDSLEVSLHVDLEHASLLSFSLKHIPRILKLNDINALDFLELRYKVPWPVNIVITETAVSRYGKLFSFMLQLKRTTWALKEVGQRLKRSGHQMKTRSYEQLHKLHLFRREMQHFVTVMEGYVVNQIIHVSWLEFQQQLKEVDGLDGLRECHASYLNRMLFRSLLTKKAAPVMKVVQDILSLVLRFRTQLFSGHWRMRGSHPAFDHMSGTYKRFKEYSGFLFTVVAKLVERGYQPHLEDLLLRLDFNGYYSQHTR